jgi:hypothetical protein
MESLIVLMNITTGISVTAQITTVSSMASEIKTFFNDVLKGIPLILAIFLIKTI